MRTLMGMKCLLRTAATLSDSNDSRSMTWHLLHAHDIHTFTYSCIVSAITLHDAHLLHAHNIHIAYQCTVCVMSMPCVHLGAVGQVTAAA
jgi:hypothetical protein